MYEIRTVLRHSFLILTNVNNSTIMDVIKFKKIKGLRMIL